MGRMKRGKHLWNPLQHSQGHGAELPGTLELPLWKAMESSDSSLPAVSSRLSRNAWKILRKASSVHFSSPAFQCCWTFPCILKGIRRDVLYVNCFYLSYLSSLKSFLMFSLKIKQSNYFALCMGNTIQALAACICNRHIQYSFPYK